MRKLMAIELVSALLFLGCAHERSAAKYYFGGIEAPYYAGTPAIKPECRAIRDELLKLGSDGSDGACSSIRSQCKPATIILDCLFGETRRRNFTNYIVYFELKPEQYPGQPAEFVKHQPVLIFDDQVTPYLYGAREVYVLVFTERRACIDAKLTTVVKSEPNPFDAILKALGKTLGPTQAESAGQIHKAAFVWYPLSGNVTKPGLWLAMASLPVDVSTVDWLTVRIAQPTGTAGSATDPPSGASAESKGQASTTDAECVAHEARLEDEAASDSTKKPQAAATAPYSANFLGRNAFFSNNPESKSGVGVAFAFTFNTRGSLRNTTPSLNGYAIGKLYLGRGPTLRAGPSPNALSSRLPSLGLIVGTNITSGTILDEAIAGLSFGHLFGNAGVLLGVNYYVPSNPGAGSRRKVRPLFGVDYSF